MAVRYYLGDSQKSVVPSDVERFDYLKKLESEMKPAEANVVLDIYSDATLLDDYELREEDFITEGWKAYFKIAKALHDEGISLTEDNINFYLGSTNNYETRPELYEIYKEYGGWGTIDRGIVGIKREDFEGYYKQLKKYMSVYRYTQSISLIKLSDIRDADVDEIYSGLQSKLDSAFEDVGQKTKEHNVGDGLDKLIEALDKGEQRGLDIGLHMERLNDIIKGFLPGQVYGLGALSGTGKSTLAINMLAEIVMSTNEKVVIIVNEEDYTKVQREMLIYVVNNETQASLKKDRLSEGGFNDDEKEELKHAVQILEIIGDKLKIVALESYSISEAKRVIRKYAKKGYRYFCIDTFKESLDSKDTEIWRSMQRDANALADLVKPSNLNVGLLLTYQLAKGAVNDTWLNINHIGQAKNIVDIMSVNLMVRRLKPEEYELNYTEEQTGSESKKTKKDKEYLLIFIDKNRNGPVTQKPLLYEIDYSQQRVIEKGFALMD